MKKNVRVLMLIVLVFVIIIAGLFFYLPGDLFAISSPVTQEKTDFDSAEVQTLSDGTKYIVHPDKILSGGPQKGGIGVDRGIPALAAENIRFVSVDEADAWIQDDELVLVLERGGVKRVYPLQILVWHEIANDVIAGEPIVVTYCPLCGSGIAYEGYVEHDGARQKTRFGTSGKLFNSNLIMYDELTDTYWQQIDGKAIVGALTGQELTEITIDTVVWRDWKILHPDSDVLSQETGMSRQYGKDPYGNYYEDSFLIFPVENEDERIHAKTQIYGIEIEGVFKAYRAEDVKEAGVIEDVVNGVTVRIEQLDDGRVVVSNNDSNEEIVKEVDFWFAWYAFHPRTELYGFESN